MTEQELLNKNSNMFGKFCKLIAEIECCRLNHETKQFKAKINKLKQQLVHYFVPNEKQLEIFEVMIKFGAEIITYFILNAIVANLSKTNVFGTIEKSFKNSARNLTQTTHHLSHKKAVKAVKFGFMIAAHKKINCSDGIQKWNNHFTYYLENDLQFNPAKAVEIKNATEIVASKLVKRFLPSAISVFYQNKINNELIYFPESFVEQPVIDSDELFQHLAQKAVPLMVQAKFICDLKQQNDVCRLEQALEQFKMYLTQYFDASPEFLREIEIILNTDEKLLEKGLNIFLGNYFSYVLSLACFYQ